MGRYDLAVIGNGFGGVAAAALLVSRGKRVLLITSKGDEEQDSTAFPEGPVMTYGFQDGGALRGLCDALGIAVGTNAPGLLYRVALPDHRIGIYTAPERTDEEIRREFPREIDAFIRCQRDARALAARITRSRFTAFRSRYWKVGSILDRYRFSNGLEMVLDLPARYFFGLPVRELPVTWYLSLLIAQPVHLPGGFGPLRTEFLSYFTSHGGVLATPVEVPFFQCNGRSVTGLQAGSLPMEQAHRYLLSVPDDFGSRLGMIVRDQVLPVGMCSTVLCLTDYERPDLQFSLEVRSKAGQTAEDSTCMLHAAFPLGGAGLGKDECMKIVSEIVPFLDRFVISTDLLPGYVQRTTLPQGTKLSFKKAKGSPSGLARTGYRNLMVLAVNDRAPERTAGAVLSAASRLA